MQKDTVSVPIDFEHLLSRLFGQQVYHGFVGIHKLKDWKKHVLKLVNAMQKSIIVNVVTTDDLHKKELLRICQMASDDIQRAQTTDQINLSLIEHLVRLLFELMGGMPDHFGYKVVNRKELWKLDTYRALAYMQTSHQKVCLIHSLPDKHPYNDNTRLPSSRDLWFKWWRDFQQDDDKFIQWFKETYPDVYAYVF